MPRHPRRRAADRDAGVRLDALHLHRVRADVLPHRRRRATCSCRWPRRSSSRCWRRTSCRARWCRRWRSTCCRRTRTIAHASRAQPQSVRAACSARFDGGFERLRDGYRGAARAGASRTARVFAARLPASCCVASLGAAAAGSATTSSRRSTPARSSCTCARRPARASRRRRALCDQVERRDPRRSIPPQRARRRILDNIGLPVQRHQPLATANVGADRRRPTPRSWSRSTEGHRPTARVRPRAARDAAAASSPASTFFFLAGRHRHARS